MTSLIMRCAVVCLLFCGCENPFRSRGSSAMLGVWEAQSPTLEIRSIAFLSQGRYWENNVQAGTYVILASNVGASGLENLVFTTHTVRVEYLDGGRVTMYVRVPSNTTTEIQVSGASGRGGPPEGTYLKLHTGDGL